MPTYTNPTALDSSALRLRIYFMQLTLSNLFLFAGIQEQL